MFLSLPPVQHTYYSDIGIALATSLAEKGDLDIMDFQAKLLATFGFGKLHLFETGVFA
jgi:hypothetical protein